MNSAQPVRATARLNRVWQRGRDFLGAELPIMCGAMTWISDPQLVSRMSNLGAFGCLAAGNMPPEQWSEYVDQTRRLTDRPFAGNVITIAPNYIPHLEILCEKQVSHIIFAGSIPLIARVFVPLYNVTMHSNSSRMNFSNRLTCSICSALPSVKR